MSMNHLKRLFRLNHESLSKQGPFWLSIFIPLAISLLLCIPLWIHTTIDLSPDGYGKFLDIYKLPIGILSLTIPLVAIIAHIHRTIQTAEQINSAKKKNLTDSFFSHNKFITDALTKIAPRKIKISGGLYELKIEDPYHIYNIFFKNSSYENGIITSEITMGRNEIVVLLEDIYDKLDDASEPFTNITVEIKKLNALIKSVSKLTKFLAITNNFPDGSNVVMYAKNDERIIKLITFHHNETELKKHLSAIFYFIKKICLIMSVEIEIETSALIYSSVRETHYCYFKEVYRDSADTKESVEYTASSDVTGELHSEYIAHQASIYF